ncbi:MAG TPA: ribonuclease J, partial [Firmicutes bacterium]|nr:ribonuclease J [Bacillota bacterium]
ASILAGPDIITRGFVYVKESEELISKVKQIAQSELQTILGAQVTERMVLKNKIKQSVEKYVFSQTKRRPSIFPIIMEV